MQINSHEVVDFIGKNFNKLVRKHSYLGRNKVEDALNTLALYLIAKPRHIPDPEGWIAVSVKRKVIRNNDKDVRFLYESSDDSLINTINNFKDETNYYEKMEENQEFNFLRKKFHKLVDEELNNEQKNAILNFINNEEFSDENSKHLFLKAKRRLIEVIKNPEKSNKFKARLKDINEKYKNRKGSCGKRINISQELCDEIINSLILGVKGYNITQTAKKFNICPNFIHRQIKKRNMPTVPRKKAHKTKESIKGQRKRISQDIKDQIIANLRLNTNGYNITELSQKFNVSRSAIKREIKKLNINFNSLNT